MMQEKPAAKWNFVLNISSVPNFRLNGPALLPQFVTTIWERRVASFTKVMVKSKYGCEDKALWQWKRGKRRWRKEAKEQEEIR
jgi:hypothetical protein